ncbi:unnamed protein product [Rotaria socialis]|uniref:CBM1 domain-containing protein n=1 Tax=Rotaria socialis TaxID=392032 RepID=A0A820YKM7_9BILA|nr:unnamed protein product [Rotaria socialis]CAF3307499.1 unnamed protein product [Rotaria socialis]CAF3468663.1 unnamed protein product [Rotaria socialis]CAF3481354.1 unnamed protein product [Rotaria socialis]CAF3583141.1 unnamed protein product [Rotaria socialis]
MTFKLLALIVLVTIVESVSTVGIFEQCAGAPLNPTFQRCDPGLVCYARSPFYANCQLPNNCPSSWACTVVESASTVISTPRTILANQPCNTQSYTVCAFGTTCLQRTPTESECRSQCQAGWECDRAVAKEFEQCGGEGYFGVTRCAAGLNCYTRSRWYAHCAVRCPGSNWSC